jgi:hypothetical protein
MSRTSYSAALASFVLGCFLIVPSGRAELIAHFPFDGDAVDEAGAREAIIGEGVTLRNDGGKFGGAAEFEGVGGVQLEYAEELNPEDAFTITAWVNPTDTTSWNSVITSRSHFGDVVSGYIIYNSPESNWDFWTGGGGAPGTWGRNIGPIAEIEEWQHLAITYDGSTDTKTLYVNGQEEVTVSGQGYMPNPNNPVNIGIGGDLGTEFFFIGLIDDLSIWNETLDEATIQRIMNDGVAAAGGGGGLLGDFNRDNVLNAADIDALSAQIRTQTNPVAYDVTGDGKVDEADRTRWVEVLKKTWFGDADLNGEFNSSDFVTVFQAGQYEDAVVGNSTWATGDWNGDTEFTSGDFVTAFQGGGFEQGARAAVAAVPEPHALMLSLLSGIGFFSCRRRQP